MLNSNSAAAQRIMDLIAEFLRTAEELREDAPRIVGQLLAPKRRRSDIRNEIAVRLMVRLTDGMALYQQEMIRFCGQLIKFMLSAKSAEMRVICPTFVYAQLQLMGLAEGALSALEATIFGSAPEDGITIHRCTCEKCKQVENAILVYAAVPSETVEQSETGLQIGIAKGKFYDHFLGDYGVRLSSSVMLDPFRAPHWQFGETHEYPASVRDMSEDHCQVRILANHVFPAMGFEMALERIGRSCLMPGFTAQSGTIDNGFQQIRDVESMAPIDDPEYLDLFPERHPKLISTRPGESISVEFHPIGSGLDIPVKIVNEDDPEPPKSA